MSCIIEQYDTCQITRRLAPGKDFNRVKTWYIDVQDPYEDFCTTWMNSISLDHVEQAL